MRQSAACVLALTALFGLGVAVPARCAAPGAAGPTTRPVRAAAVPSDDYRNLLGERFTSRAAGISLQPPMGGKQQRRLGIGAGEPFVTFWSDEDRWTLKVLQIVSSVSTSLVGEPAPPAESGKPQPSAKVGLLDEMQRQLQQGNTGTQILRKDVINVGPYDTGVLISRYTVGQQTWLHQQAIIQANDMHFYVLDFTTPSGRSVLDTGDVEDGAERIAAGLFDTILTTVRVFDTQPVQVELARRAYAGKAFQVNLPQRAEAMLAPEQYARILLKGKDVGWIYTTEAFDQYDGVQGLRVTTLMHRQDSPKLAAIDTACEMFTAVSRTEPSEAWRTIVKSTFDGKVTSSQEYGVSSRQTRKAIVEIRPSDPRQRVSHEVRNVNEYKLTVTQTTPAGSNTVERDLMNYYLPQAAGVLLPALLPHREKKGYAFPVWVASEQQVIWRYVDVLGDQEIKFNGKTFIACVVRDSISLEGDATLHYFAADGAFLGSDTPSAGISIVPADEKTIRGMYPHAEIGRPSILKTMEVPKTPAGFRPRQVLPSGPADR